jgi:hypothetical protein
MYRKLRAPLLIVGACLVLLYVVAKVTPRPGQVSFITIDAGVDSGIYSQQALLITNQAEWTAHWNSHRPIVPPKPAPAVNFAAEAVVAVHLGRSANTLQVTRVRVRNGRVIVDVQQGQFRLEPGHTMPTQTRRPYQIIRIPAVPPGSTLDVRWQTPWWVLW